MKIGNVRLGGIPKIAAVIVDGEDMKAISAAKMGGADLLELRLDCFKNHEQAYINRIIKNIKKTKLPLIATIRSRKEGGKTAIGNIERLKLFESIIPLVAAVDIELSSKKILNDVVNKAHGLNKKTIISYHNFKNTPDQKKLNALVKNCRNAGGDIVKIATIAKNKKDVIRLAALMTQYDNIIVIAMGMLGTATRILFPMLGSLITYCSVTQSSAPGQLSLKDTKMFLKKLKGV